MEAYAWADPNIDLENPEFVASVEWVWPEGDWTHFSLVRSVRSPVRRREEGQMVMEVQRGEWTFTSVLTGKPVYRDPQPPPGEWVYYTAFVLNTNRVWTRCGTAYEVGVADYDWTLRLPELLPGVAIADRQQTMAPAQHGNDLVQFFQNPGGFLDRAVTMAEATQFFWNPLRCPPQMLRHLLRSIGYEYDNTLGTGRIRHVINALMEPQQGSVLFISSFAAGVTGCAVDARISNNLMIDVNESSFESGELADTHWEPTAGLEVRSYEDWLSPTPVLPPNVQISHFLYVPDARTLTNGAADPIRFGIPIAAWSKARMGCYAFGDGTNLTLILGLYDYEGLPLEDLTIHGPVALTASWSWYGNADDSAVALPSNETQEYLPSDALTNPARWGAAALGYAGPQTITPVAVAEGMQFDWETAPTNDPANGALWGIGNVEIGDAVVGATYRVSMTVNGAVGTERWRPTVGWQASGEWQVPDGTDQTTTFLWTATITDPFVGIEVEPEDTDWTGAGPHVVKAFSFERINTKPAYGLPIITVDGEASLDLIVVDDG